MSPEAKTLLTQALALPGAAAWCVRAATGTCEHHRFTNWFKPAQLEALLPRLASALDGLRQRELEPVQVCWVFEHARLFLAQRPSGETLALFVENRSNVDFTAHQAAVAEFAAGTGGIESIETIRDGN